jgi:galactokinase
MDIYASFSKHFGFSPGFIARSPGRVNMLGEHVDYNSGPVLPSAIDRAVELVAAPDPDGIIHLAAVDLAENVSFRTTQLDKKVALDGRPLPGWALYPAGVAWALQEAGLPVSGLKAVYHSNVPIGAGLSSSAAVEVGFGVLWQAINGWKIDRLTLAQICQRAENAYVGLSCGLMDQFACACGVEGHALYFDTRSLEWRPVLLPEGTAIVIADSGVRRSLTNSAYNDRRASCEQAVELLRPFLPSIQSLRDVKPVEFAAFQSYLPPIIQKRAEHVVKEIARVESAVTALQRQDAQAFGALMFASHASLRDLYEVSTPELDTLVELARNLPGCLGARLTGAGFGGCTVNLVQAPQAELFIEQLIPGYHQATERQAQVYLCRASQGAVANEITNNLIQTITPLNLAPTNLERPKFER